MALPQDEVLVFLWFRFLGDWAWMEGMAAIGAKLRTAWGLSLQEKLWLALLYPLSGFWRLCLLTLPFRWVAKVLGDCQKGDSPILAATEEQEERARRIGRMCSLAARHTPWDSKCLVQALMARTLLGCYGIPYLIRIGVDSGDAGAKQFKAHAWTQVGRLVVTGRQGHMAFTVLTSYSSRSR